MTDEEVIKRMMTLYKPQLNLPMIPWLEKPSECSQDIWDIIMPCWHREASERPPFKRIYAALRAEQQRAKLKIGKHFYQEVTIN